MSVNSNQAGSRTLLDRHAPMSIPACNWKRQVHQPLCSKRVKIIDTPIHPLKSQPRLPHSCDLKDLRCMK